MLAGREAPGIGTTTGASASSHASVTCCGLTPCASATSWNAACREPTSPARLMPPSGLHGRNAMPSAAQCSSSPCEDRNAGENWFCTETRRPPRIAWASSICATVALEMPASSITPSSSSSRIAPTESAYGTRGSGRWNWYSPMASTPSRRAEAFAASLRCSGRPSWVQLPSPGRR